MACPQPGTEKEGWVFLLEITRKTNSTKGEAVYHPKVGDQWRSPFPPFYIEVQKVHSKTKDPLCDLKTNTGAEFGGKASSYERWLVWRKKR